MTTFTISHVPHSLYEGMRDLGTRLAAIGAGIVDGIVAHRRFKALSSLSDHQLAQLGISRAGIADHVLNDRRQRVTPGFSPE